MRLLLDTHAVIWWFQGNLRLPQRVRDTIEGEASDVFVSAVSAFEIALKHRMGKLPEAAALARRFSVMTQEQGFAELAVTVPHGLAAGALPIAHRDPFDRLLIAQALVEDMTIASNERLFDSTGVNRLW
ncbi:MAG TPA: type II toxin-antitoxin system VapC family toxin [Caulobacteraceae bacterium]|nr:type II toxin-antitoxin system VapC family toxin [Caulobacteraceae bacterium]